MADAKKMVKPFGWLFALVLIIAIIGRIGLGIAGATGVLAFDYISASGVAILDVICSILTGSAFVAFLFAAGLALCASTAGVVLYGALYARGDIKARPTTAFLAGWATALVAMVSLVILALGILSAVQVGSMSSKLPSMPVIILGVIVFAAFLGTLLGAAAEVVCACVARARRKGSLGAKLALAVTVCGLIVMVLTVGTFASLNTTAINLPVLGTWFVADIIMNLAILFTARGFVQKAEEPREKKSSQKKAGRAQTANGAA